MKWTQEEVELLNNTDLDTNKIHNLLHRKLCAVERKRQRLGINMDVIKYNKLVNHDFFEIETPESMYILGFIAADGCIYLRKYKNISYSLLIHIGAKDIDILKSIKEIMQFNGKIYFSKRRNIKWDDQCSIDIRSDKICKKLNDIGITPRKSLTLKWPNISDKYISHFVRGYVDGDGCIRIDKNKQLVCHICGTKEFLTVLLEKFRQFSKKERGSLYKHKNIYNLTYAGNKIANMFCDWIYQDSNPNIRLARKYNIYMEHQNVCASQ